MGAIDQFVAMLDQMVPPTAGPFQQVGVAGTLTIRRAIIPKTDPKGIVSPTINTQPKGGTTTGSGLYTLPPGTALVLLGSTYFYGVPWLSLSGSTPGYGAPSGTTDGQIYLLCQPPLMFILGNISGT